MLRLILGERLQDPIARQAHGRDRTLLARGRRLAPRDFDGGARGGGGGDHGALLRVDVDHRADEPGGLERRGGGVRTDVRGHDQPGALVADDRLGQRSDLLGRLLAHRRRLDRDRLHLHRCDGLGGLVAGVGRLGLAHGSPRRNGDFARSCCDAAQITANTAPAQIAA